MEELQGPLVRRRLLPREVTGEQQDALMDTIEWRYNICMLHYCLQRDEEGEEHRYSVFDSAWLMEQYRELLHVPRYALMKSCPRGDNASFSFHPLIYQEKVYSEYYELY